MQAFVEDLGARCSPLLVCRHWLACNVVRGGRMECVFLRTCCSLCGATSNSGLTASASLISMPSKRRPAVFVKTCLYTLFGFGCASEQSQGLACVDPVRNRTLTPRLMSAARA